MELILEAAVSLSVILMTLATTSYAPLHNHAFFYLIIIKWMLMGESTATLIPVIASLYFGSWKISKLHSRYKGYKRIGKKKKNASLVIDYKYYGEIPAF